MSPRKAGGHQTWPACTRFPCDSAYRRRAHTPNEDGVVFHLTNVRQEYFDVLDDNPTIKWRVAVVAQDDGPWQLLLQVGDSIVWLDKPDQIEDLAESVTRAALWTSKARLSDAQEVPL